MLKKLTIVLFLLMPSFYLLAQKELAYNDTSYFIPFDDDFNLIISASKGHLNNVENLLHRGADINAVTVDNVSALMYASENGDFNMVRFLVERGARPNIRPFNGVTALISAAKFNYLKIAEFLINNDARINESDEDGITPLHYAVAYNYPKMVEMLLYYGADPDKADRYGNIPAVTAAYNNSLDALKTLHEEGENIDKQDGKGFTPLMVSIDRGNRETTDWLLEHNPNINVQNEGGMTPLAFAIKNSDYRLVELLIEKGAEVNHKISGSKNLLELSKEQEDDDITELLILNDAKNNLYPNFNSFILGPGFEFSADEFMTGLQFGISDSKYNTTIYTGFSFRPSATRILTEPESDTLFQFWERRYLFHAGLNKRFALIKTSQEIHSGPYISGEGILTFGAYRGSNEKPRTKFLFSPIAGWYYANKLITLSAGYRYIDFGISNLSPHRFTFSLLFNIPVTPRKSVEKNIEWLNFE